MRARIGFILSRFLTVLFVLVSAAALAHGFITANEFQIFRGVIYAFIALAFMISQRGAK